MEKTDHLLRAWVERAPGACYVPVDVSESALESASRAITSKWSVLQSLRELLSETRSTVRFVPCR